MAHLSALANDHSVKASDRAQLAGYSKKWTCAKFVFGCALYIDAPKPASLLSLSLQEL